MGGQKEQDDKKVWVFKTMKNEKGFTLVEMLLSFSMMLLILTFLVMMLQLLFNENERDFNQLEWEVFIQQAKYEAQGSNTISLRNNIVTFARYNGEMVSYEPYQQVIRRRVNGTGHEVLLQNVKSVKYEATSNGIIIEVNDKYKARISSIIPIEVK